MNLNWKFLNLEACELKVSTNLGACELKFMQKLRLLRLKFPNFLKRGSCKLTILLEMGPCELQERREKGVFRAAHPRTPFLGQCPPPRAHGSLCASCMQGLNGFPQMRLQCPHGPITNIMTHPPEILTRYHTRREHVKFLFFRLYGNKLYNLT